MIDIKKEKESLRKELIKRRKNLSRKYKITADKKISEEAINLREYKNAKTVFSYVSTEDEIDTFYIIKESFLRGKKVGIPKCQGKGIMNVYEIKSLEDLELGAFGILEPKSYCSLIEPEKIDIAFVPCLSADKNGIRIGYGGGFYDRYLENTDFFKVALCREKQLEKELPSEENDQPMDIILTERRNLKMAERKLIGTFFETGSSAVIECYGRTGMDFFIIDTEHGYFTEDSVVDYIRSAENVGILPYVRIGDIRRPYVLRMADIGARGIIIPNIKTPQQVQEIISYAKFAPIGDRGFCPTRVTGWGADEWAQETKNFMEESNRRLKVIPQCETKEAFENIEEIVSMEGVDGIFVGPCDLSISLGVPLEFDSPVLIDAIMKVQKTCERYGKESYIFAGDMEAAKNWLAKGFNGVACGLDAAVITKAYKNIVEELR